jgi:hypothetical protein
MNCAGQAAADMYIAMSLFYHARLAFFPIVGGALLPEHCSAFRHVGSVFKSHVQSVLMTVRVAALSPQRLPVQINICTG